MLVYSSRKGFAIGSTGTSESVPESMSLQGCGLDRLQWSDLFENPQSDDNDVDVAEVGGDEVDKSSKKLTRQQKREQRQMKKINAAQKRKAKREQELHNASASTNSSTDISHNPYDTKLKIKSVYSKILELSKQEGNNASVDHKIIQYHSIALYKSDLEHILPEEWLCDNNISFVYELICNLVIKEFAHSHEIYLLFPSLVQLFLHMPFDRSDPSILEAMLPMKELKRLKLIFIPMNYIDDFQSVDMEGDNNGDHWFLCVLCLLNNKLYVYDSMYSEDDDDSLLFELCKRLQLCKGLILNQRKIDIVKMNCAQQDNFDDCGVFLLMFTAILVGRLIEGTDEEQDRDVSLDIKTERPDPLQGRLFIFNLIHQLYRTQTRINRQ